MKHKLFETLRGLGTPFRHILQVGANTGQELELFRHYEVDLAIMVEPLDDAYRTLCENIGEDRRFIPVKALCFSDSGLDLDFHEASNSQSSSALAPSGHLLEYPAISFAPPRTLRSTTVDDILLDLERERPGFGVDQLDLLFLDTQGSELQVMMGAGRVLEQVRSVWTEVSFDLYEGSAEPEDIQSYLRPFGFRLMSLKIGPRGWGNALFVKRGPRA